MSHLPTIQGVEIELVRDGTDTSRRTKRGDKIAVHYTGTFVNGKKFDSSLDRGTPLEFVVGQGQVIKGWDEGLMNMAVGEERKLIIQPELGYGRQGAGGVIPPDSVLVFTTKLVAFK